MADVVRKITVEIDYIEAVLNDLVLAMNREEWTIVELLAIGACLQSVYNGVENILKQMCIDHRIEIPSSVSWHKDLLELAMEKTFISERLRDDLYEYMSFRHFFVHNYGFKLKREIIEDLATNIRTVWRNFLCAVRSLYDI